MDITPGLGIKKSTFRRQQLSRAMNRLVVNPGNPNAWEIQLKSGTNLLGRGPASDFTINDASVSGSHCQIILSDAGAVIKDLGSTNGTFINHAPVQMAALRPGQRIHLGSVEMLFESDIPVAAPAVSRAIPVALAKPPEAQSAPPKAVPVARLAINRSQPEGTPATAPPIARPISPAARVTLAPAAAEETPDTAPPVASVDVGEVFCKSHIKTPATYYCGHCSQYYCDLCVSTRPTGGVMIKTCRKCGAECTPVQAHFQSLASPKGFFARLPGAFLYPLRGSGLLVLIVSTILFAAVEYMGRGLLGIFIMVLFVGYLFSYMQNILHSTAAEDNEMPELPGMDGLLGAFFSLAGTVAVSFAPAIALAVAMLNGVEIPGSALVGAIVLGCLYFPMAFLAVAMKDTVLAANPLVVVPAILKVPGEYLVATILVIGVYGIRQLADFIMADAARVSLSTSNMTVLFASFGIRALFSLANVYLLTVSIRILGLLYVSKKEKLGWF